MSTSIASVIATAIPTVPDAGPSGLLFGLALLSLGIAARVIKNRKR